jgi:integrase
MDCLPAPAEKRVDKPANQKEPLSPSRTVKGTKKHAELALAKLIHAVETGTELSGAKLTVADYAERWLDAKRKTVRPKTLERYADLFRLHIVPVIGNIQLSKLRPLHLEKVYEQAFERGLSAQSVRHIHRVLFTRCGKPSHGN